ncbi:MAG TPA: zf-HC2 domain-containing protein [Anaeromyxobacteraceae bacterium]|nr:zf-HC2 domain-containing protein [Anaeromyxobacteraceae bacterium]
MSHPVKHLTAYLDGALEFAEQTAIESHLAECPACRDERDRLAGAIALLSRLPAAAEPSPNFEQRFYARLAAQKAEVEGRAGLFGRISWRVLAVGALCVVAAAGLSLSLLRRGHTEDQFLAEHLAFAEHLELLESYEAVDSLGAVNSPEDVQIVNHLDELREGRP